jgi:hypothetical protein
MSYNKHIRKIPESVIESFREVREKIQKAVQKQKKPITLKEALEQVRKIHK